MKINPLLQVDYYKQSHYNMYPQNTTKIYSNLTPRKSRLPGINSVVVFGLQYYLTEYLIDQWNEYFFNRPKDEVISEFKRIMDNTLGKNSISTSHIEELHDLGYLPLHIKALPEGSLCPIGVPCVTITNTVDHAYWLVNFLETSLSYTIWQPTTSATLAFAYKKLLTKYALETTGDTSLVQWIGHDFSLRGMSSLESACTSGAGHLLSFTGTDTIPAISFLEQYYGADVEKELVGASVPATEHSVMCMGTKDDEIGTFKALMDKYPSGILSVVSDTWDLWKVCTEYVVQLKDQILARDGKLVIRPDSGDPVNIICGNLKPSPYTSLNNEIGDLLVDGIYYQDRGFTNNHRWEPYHVVNINPLPSSKGVIELLWDVFGGTINEQGYKVLDPHIGAIYGDSITLERADEICKRLKAKGFASTNIVFGIGSYTYQMNTRDTFGFAMKATYGELTTDRITDLTDTGGPYLKEKVIEAREIFKDPITDDGTKRSAKGLLLVERFPIGNDIVLIDQVSKKEEQGGLLETIFLDGKLVKFQTLSEIRERLNTQLHVGAEVNI
jgi:nicotinamide phosphoribosyltransferase